MRRLLPLVLALLPVLAHAQTNGWAKVGEKKDAGFTWTTPLFNGFWMAWTPLTLAFFGFVFGLIALMGVMEWVRPGGAERDGVLGLTTTRGDRLFISLLGSAFILLAWLFFVGQSPILGGVAVCAAWFAFVFWKV
jgi:predicted small integral membrane protein